MQAAKSFFFIVIALFSFILLAEERPLLKIDQKNQEMKDLIVAMSRHKIISDESAQDLTKKLEEMSEEELSELKSYALIRLEEASHRRPSSNSNNRLSQSLVDTKERRFEHDRVELLSKKVEAALDE